MRYISLQQAQYSKWEAYYLYDMTHFKNWDLEQHWFHEENKKFFDKYSLVRHWNKYGTKMALNTKEYILSKSDSEVTFF